MRVVAAGLYQWLLFLHILAAMIWFGGLLSLNLFATIALRGRDPQTLERFLRSLRVLGPATLAPAMAAVLAFGIWLAVDSPLWNFGQGWLDAGLGIFVAAFVYGAIFQSRLAIGAERAAAAGDT